MFLLVASGLPGSYQLHAVVLSDSGPCRRSRSFSLHLLPCSSPPSTSSLWVFVCLGFGEWWWCLACEWRCVLGLCLWQRRSGRLVLGCGGEFVLAWLAFVLEDGSGMNWEGFVSSCCVWLCERELEAKGSLRLGMKWLDAGFVRFYFGECFLVVAFPWPFAFPQCPLPLSIVSSYDTICSRIFWSIG